MQCRIADHKVKCIDCGGCYRVLPKHPGAIIPAKDFLKEHVVHVTKHDESRVGVKFDADKPDWSLLPLGAVEEVVKVMSFGAKKYTRGGWKELPNAEDRYLAAMFRHIKAHRSGEEFDDESGLPHLAHAATCLVFLLELRK